MKKRLIAHLTILGLATLFLGFFDMPFQTQKAVMPAVPDSMEQQKIHLGLDLQGGTQLDYKIDLRKVAEADQEQIIGGVLEVLTRRVNGLGVSEPNIYRSQIADEEHIIIELAGIKDIEEAKNTVGKMIQLEFKEEGDEAIAAENLAEIEALAESALSRVKNGEDFTLVGEEEELANPGKAYFFGAPEDDYSFQENLPEAYFPMLDEIEFGEILPELIQTNDGYTFDTYGNLTALEGYFIVQLLDKREGEKPVHEDKEVEASHVLITYKGSQSAGEDVTRTKKEARAFAEEIRERAIDGEDFATLAQENSEGPSGPDGGELGFFAPGVMTQNFEDAAFAMEINEISDIVETEFGFHVIKVTDIKEAVNETEIMTEYRINKIFYSTAADPWKETGLTGEHFAHADVALTQTYTPYVSIEFNGEGGKMFEEITERNIGKRIAIFVGGELISAPNVNEKIAGGRAQITGDFTMEEASNLARDLNTGAIPAPIILVGQYTIGASLGQEALDTSVKAGIIGLILLVLYMLLYYRLPGLLANLALFMYAILLVFCIKVALPLGLALLISLTIFTVIISAILKSEDSGWEKLISFLVACFVLFFFTYLLSNHVVLTLAGVAGVVLSIGMAVDANILIFERIREELRNKRPLSGAIEVGFDRAWSSIRDSNFSSLITCAILIYFGTSIIKGFAVNLALGIMISMFTAITVTRTLLRASVHTKFAQSKFLLGVPKKGHPRLPIIQKRKIWFAFSGILIIASLILIPINGLNFGLDFTGGTLMEVQFNNEEKVPTADQVTEKVKAIEQDLLAAEALETPEVIETVEDTTSTPEDAPQALEVNGSELVAIDDEPEIPVDFGEPIVVSSGDSGYIIRMKHISSDAHEMILANLETSFGELEETRFNTIGPTIGETMKQKAVMALILAIIFIVLYIAFAFRHIPKHTSAWRFGWSAIAALIHDVLITVGVFVVLGSILGVEIDALFVTALLTIMGFSVHDTIVTFDRVRENLKRQKAGEEFEVVANRAVNQTVARSINTSISTLFTVAALFFLGAGSIHFFLLALIVGLIAGTYSSIFTATPLLVAWHNWKNRK